MDAANVCENILKSLKVSNLHFLLHENAFSAKVTIRKKFINENIISNISDEPLKAMLEQKIFENEQFKIVNLKLEKANKKLEMELDTCLKRIKSEDVKSDLELQLNKSNIEHQKEINVLKQAK